MMDERNNTLYRTLITLGGAVSGFWVRLPDAVHILVYVMAADIATGLCRAGMAGEINSNCSFKGMMKKAAMLVLTALGVILDSEMKPNAHLGSMLALAFTAVEGMSIIENCDAMGIPLPPGFRDIFRNARKRAWKEQRPEEKDKKENKQ